MLEANEPGWYIWDAEQTRDEDIDFTPLSPIGGLVRVGRLEVVPEHAVVCMRIRRRDEKEVPVR